jgi:hypothetical protein
MAAVLAGGDGAHLSHRSAAALWGVLPNRGEIQITTKRRLRPRDKINFHSQSLLLDEVTTYDGIPTTTVARTLLDIAATEPDQLERAFNEAEYLRLWDATGVAELIDRYPRRSGAPALRALLDAGAKGITREELEHRFHAFVEEHGLPRPELNADLEIEPGRWIRVDCLWRAARLIVELDGHAAHSTTSRFHSDRERDRLLALAGWTVVRVTSRHLTDRLATDLDALIRR